MHGKSTTIIQISNLTEEREGVNGVDHRQRPTVKALMLLKALILAKHRMTKELQLREAEVTLAISRYSDRGQSSHEMLRGSFATAKTTTPDRTRTDDLQFLRRMHALFHQRRSLIEGNSYHGCAAGKVPAPSGATVLTATKILAVACNLYNKRSRYL